MKNNQKIQISIKEQGRYIKINIPPKIKLLEKSLGSINKTESKEIKDVPSEEINYYSDCPYFISRQLTKNEKFRKVFNQVLEENQDYNYCRLIVCAFSQSRENLISLPKLPNNWINHSNQIFCFHLNAFSMRACIESDNFIFQN